MYIEDGNGVRYNGIDADISALFIPKGRNGLWLDPETGLYYVRARYYDSVLGRWRQRDPVETHLVLQSELLYNSALPKVSLAQDVDSYAADGPNKYLYLQSRPTTSFDPTGLHTFEGRSEGPWVDAGSVNWTRSGDAIFFYNTSVSLPVAGIVGVVLETWSAIFPTLTSGGVHDYALVSQWRPGELHGTTCWCRWHRSQNCKRCVTTASVHQLGFFDKPLDMPTVSVMQGWEEQVLADGSTWTIGIMYTTYGNYDYRCGCSKPTIRTPICPRRDDFQCGEDVLPPQRDPNLQTRPGS